MATFLIWLPIRDAHLINLTIHVSRHEPGDAPDGGPAGLAGPNRPPQGPEGTVSNPDY